MVAGDVIVINENTSGRKAVALDGTDDYILADAHAVARVAGNDTVGTYSAWIYKDVLEIEQTILSAGDNDNTNEFLQFLVDDANKLKIILNHAGATQFSVKETTGSIPARTWTHVAIVMNGTRPILYVNGKAVAMTDATATDLTFWYDELTLTDKFAIGVKESNNTHTTDFSGMISDVKYWNKALTDAEMLEDSKGNALADDDTYLQLHLLDGDNGITDQGLGADNGTLTGHAYLCGYGSKWSRDMKLSGAVGADQINTVVKGSNNETIIVKAA